MVLLEGWRHVMERGNGSRHVSVMVGVRVVVVAKVGGIGNKKWGKVETTMWGRDAEWLLWVEISLCVRVCACVFEGGGRGRKAWTCFITSCDIPVSCYTCHTCLTLACLSTAATAILPLLRWLPACEAAGDPSQGRSERPSSPRRWRGGRGPASPPTCSWCWSSSPAHRHSQMKVRRSAGVSVLLYRVHQVKLTKMSHKKNKWNRDAPFW